MWSKPTEEALTVERENPRVVVRVWDLARKKSLEENRTINPRVIIEETGLPRNAIYRAANGELREMPLWVLSILADYFGVEPGELFKRP